MIRTLLLAAGFLAVTIALLLMQPGYRVAENSFDSVPVTRADSAATDFTPAAPPQERSVAAPVPSPEPQPRPQARPAAIESFAAALAAPEPSAAPTTVETAALEVAALDNARETRDPLLVVPSPGEDAVQNKIALMTQNILLELRNPDAKPSAQVDVAAPTAAVNPFAMRLAAAASAGQPDIALVAMIDEALAQGEISADAAFYAANGDLDAPILLLSLLPNRAPQTVAPPREDVLYRVQPNDSLAGIAALFYGRPDAYTAILSANPDGLRRPQDLFTGQLLRIPAL